MLARIFVNFLKNIFFVLALLIFFLLCLHLPIFEIVNVNIVLSVRFIENFWKFSEKDGLNNEQFENVKFINIQNNLRFLENY